MIYLLDVSVLVALLIEDHEFYGRAVAWARGKRMALCPLSELGFLRVAMNAYEASQDQARKALGQFMETDKPEFIPADCSALAAGAFPSAKQSTDWYLAVLAERHQMKLATFDGGIKHAAAELVP